MPVLATTGSVSKPLFLPPIGVIGKIYAKFHKIQSTRLGILRKTSTQTDSIVMVGNFYSCKLLQTCRNSKCFIDQ